MVERLYTEVFRPQKLEHAILPKRIEDYFKGEKLNQNVLLYGTQGTGKTTVAKILAKKYPTLYINVSDETGIDVVRNKITKWGSTISVLDGNESIKVVILDELDGAAAGFFQAMRGTIEKFAENVRFIGTCNYINKIPEPILDRFELISFDSASKEEEIEVLKKIIKRIHTILKKINIEIEDKALIEFVKRNFPSMRKMITKIQSWKIRGVEKVTLDDIRELNYSYADVFKIALNKPNPLENYKFLIVNYSDKVDNVLSSLGSELPEYIRENEPDKVLKIPQIIIEVAQHQAQRTQVIDPVITMLSCVFKIQTILNS